MTEDQKCPVPHAASGGTKNSDWWPDQLPVEKLLHRNPRANPLDNKFDYAKEFETLYLDKVKEDIAKVMKTSQDWWPADYGHYGPLFIRMAWHSAGTYRVTDGRGGGSRGLQRFAPLNSWPDNVNLDKARRLLWPVKKKYGQRLSWADLMILAGNVALEDMGFPTFGFAGGREDVWQPDNTYWGNEIEWLANKRYDESREADTLEDPLAAVQMGLIYVNPEGPDGIPDAALAAKDIRETFARMAMNDEETVALIAGGHAFGKTHGAGPATNVGANPEGSPIEDAGFGWKNSYGEGHGKDTISSGLEGAWTPTPTKWDNSYLKLIFKYNWEKTYSPAGAVQWEPINCQESDMTPDAHIPGKMNKPVMLTTDLALRYDPIYKEIAKKFLNDFDYFTNAFARAWFKLTHRDMGPRSRYYGSEVPSEILLWQDPVPSFPKPDKETLDLVKTLIDEKELDVSDLVRLAYASASTYRDTDRRGGANGARIALEPQRSWPINAAVLPTLEAIEEIHKKVVDKISLADLIVFAGFYAIEKASGATIEFGGGRGDATQDQTDIESFNYLYPVADAFINWSHKKYAGSLDRLLIDKAELFAFSPAQMTLLYGGLRSLGVSTDNVGVLTNRPGTLSNDFFVNILDMDIEWKPVENDLYHGLDRKTKELRWIASRADLAFASNSILRSYCEAYASDDAKDRFIGEFIRIWTKLMTSDLF